MKKEEFKEIITLGKKKKRLFCVAHRGLSSLAPDNSIRAIELALNCPRVDGIEFDIQKTRDGYLILRHNRAIQFEGKLVWLRDITFSQLRSVAGKETVPAFSDVLPLFAKNEKILDVELKEKGIAGKVIQILKSKKLYGRVVFSSVYEDINREIKDADPSVARMFGYPRDRGKDLAHRKWLEPGVQIIIKYMKYSLKGKIPGMIKQNQTPFISLYHKVLSPAVIATIHRNKGLCLGVTIRLHDDMDEINSVKIMRQMLDFGVDAIKTDYPQLLTKIEMDKKIC